MLAHVLASDIGKMLSLLNKGSGFTPFCKSTVISVLELRVLQNLGFQILRDDSEKERPEHVRTLTELWAVVVQ